MVRKRQRTRQGVTLADVRKRALGGEKEVVLLIEYTIDLSDLMHLDVEGDLIDPLNQYGGARIVDVEIRETPRARR